MTVVKNARLACVAMALMAVAACGGDSNDPTPFDPAGTTGDMGAAMGTLESSLTGDMGHQLVLVGEQLGLISGGGGPVLVSQSIMRTAFRADTTASRQLMAAAKPLLRSRAAVSGSAVVLPPELLGNVYEWDAVADEYVESERTDGPDNGVRFVLYAIDPVTNDPTEPLNELGYLDLTDLSTGSADVGRIVVVSQGVTYFDYRVTATGTENDGNVNVAGFMTDGDDRVNFDLRTGFTYTEASEALHLDYELEFPTLDVTLSYLIDLAFTATSDTQEYEASLRGPHGYLDFSGVESSSAEGELTDLTFEVNGEEFATVSCVDDAACVISGADGQPLTEDELEALESFYGLWQTGLFVSIYLLMPAGVFFPMT